MESAFRKSINRIVFSSETRGGKIFDVAVIVCIIISIIVVILDSVPEISIRYHDSFYVLEWIFTIIFSLEYILRIIATKRPLRYIFSFYGIVDLLATIPTYVGLFLSGGSSLLALRALRLFRIFRVFKLSRYTSAGIILRRSLSASRDKIFVFLVAVFSVIIVIGTLMYLVEGEKGGFTSIPRSIYWTIVTITTVGYGDIAPVTGLGRFLASITMLTGYAIIAVPTGIVTAEITKQQRLARDGTIPTGRCGNCHTGDHDEDAEYCKHCGTRLD